MFLLFAEISNIRVLKGAVTHAPGTDGTVRWAGCALNTRKITLDFTKPPKDENRYAVTKWPVSERSNLAMPFMPIEGLNHASIIENPSKELVEMVGEALMVNSMDTYTEWIKNNSAKCRSALAAMDTWQQFMIKARDERGDPITDFNLLLYKVPRGRDPQNEDDWQAISIDVHSYSTDNSFRCFHVNLKELLDENLECLRLELMASSGTILLGYLDYVDEKIDSLPKEGQPTFTMDLTPLLTNKEVKFFYPFTTTLIEIILNREPLPLMKKNEITWFLDK